MLFNLINFAINLLDPTSCVISTYYTIYSKNNALKYIRLNSLMVATVLPLGCCPLIVTDAGYRNTWFKEVERHGWFWLGRVRGDVSFMPNGQTAWQSNKSLYPKANSTAKDMGTVQLARKSPLQYHLHLFRAKPKLRKDKRSSKAGHNHTAQKNYSLGSKAPWLLAINLPPDYFDLSKVVDLYAKRCKLKKPSAI